MASEARPSIALVSREFWPFHTGGGMGRYARATVALLAESADVTAIVPDFYAGRLPPDDPRLPRGVRFEFIPEPDRSDPRPFASLYHAWSAAAYDALRRLYPGGGPDLVEFNDYTGEGAVSVQAKRTGDPALARTRIVVGVHGTDEIHRVLNGQSLSDPEAAALTALERIGLAGADVVFSPGGDVADTYERYYGEGAVARSRFVTHPFALDAALAPGRPPADGPLRLIHAGRFERRKGVAELIEAVRALDRDDLRLTLIGGDTPTGPAGTSMLECCRRLAAGDERIEFRDRTDFEGILAAYAEHHVVVIPSRWETNANTAREALMVGRPVLATPTGGLVQIVEDGVNGWLTPGTSAGAIADTLERLVDDRDEVARLVGSEELPRSLSRSVRNEEALAAYLEEARPAREPVRPPVDVKVVNLEGTGRAEFLGDGAIAVVPPGVEVLPGFAERCGRALALNPKAAYATTWAAADESWRARPLGNAVPLVESEDCGGAVLAVRPKHASRAFARVTAWELAGGGAWLLARELRAEGAYGVVVPEELVRVRHATDPSARRTEVEAALARERTRWLARHAAVGGP